MKQNSSTRLITDLLLFLSLISTPIINPGFWDSLIETCQQVTGHIGAVFGCALPNPAYDMMPFSTKNPACNAIFPYTLATCTDKNGSSVDNAPCSDNALLNFVNEGSTAEIEKKLCKTATQTLINTNNACTPVIAAATPQKYFDELTAMFQPLIDIACIITQLQAADMNNPNIFLPGCDPTNAACKAISFTDPFDNPYYYMAANLIWSYTAGYVYNYPNTTTQPPSHQPTPQGNFGIKDYCTNWSLAQTFAQNGQDQQGNQIAAQINVFNPNSFLNATNNITSQVIGDLQLALKKNIDFLTNPINDFPGSNLGLLNKKIVSCNPNATKVPCCNAPTMNLADAKANIMNKLNQKMNAILTKQQGQVFFDYFQTYTLFKPLDPTKIPPLAQINPVGLLSISSKTSLIRNNLPQPLYVGKEVINFFLSGTTAIAATQQEYLTQAAQTDQILLTAIDVNGNEVSCSPGNLTALYKNTMNLCALAAEEIAPFNAVATMLVTFAIYAAAFQLAGAGAELLADADLGAFINGLGTFSKILIRVYGNALNVGMFINFSSGGRAWFQSLPPALQDAWSPPLNIITPVNLKILEQQLECSLEETLLGFNQTDSTAIANEEKACRYNAAKLNA